LKRIIKKKKFLLDRQTGSNDNWPRSHQNESNSSSLHLSSLNYGSTSIGSNTGYDEQTPLKVSSESDFMAINKVSFGDNLDFFAIIQQEIDKINKFFVGQLAELRISLDQITSKRRNIYLSHHTSAETDLIRLRDIYVQLAALRSYCDLNQTGLFLTT
jgi:hypothetical protein